MTKRFKCVSLTKYFNSDLIEFQDNGKYTCLNDTKLEKLLNDLHEENEELKQELNYYKAMIHTDTSKR